MYVTDAGHFLDTKGALDPQRGPAKTVAEFHATVIAYIAYADFDDTGVMAATWFTCKKGQWSRLSTKATRSTGHARAG
jgi:hypothetical protein